MQFARRALARHISYSNNSSPKSSAKTLVSWNDIPKNVLITKKLNDIRATDVFLAITSYILKKYEHARVLLMVDDTDSGRLATGCDRMDVVDATQALEQCDFVIALGGDGTVLRTVSWLG